MLREILQQVTPGLVQIVLAVCAVIVTFLWRRFVRSRIDDGIAGVALDALEAGVQKAWDDIVKDMKTKSADGKLTAEERREAFEYAVSQAKRIGAEHGLDVVKTLGANMIPMLVKKIIDRRKKAATPPA